MQEVRRLSQGMAYNQSLSKATTPEPVSWLSVQWQWLKRPEMLLVPLVFTLVLVLWEGVIWLGDYPAFILPSVTDIFATLQRTISDGSLWRHAQATLFAVFFGLLLGLTIASLLGYTLAKNRMLERLLAPYIVASQSVPVIAVAPLLIIWFGPGRLSKVFICALIVFFPALINTIVGLRSVDSDLRDLMRSLRASRWQIFKMLEVPAALPVLLGGLKVSVTLSVVGAVVGEFVGADRGLGFLINQARGLFNTPLVFVAIVSLIAITICLYGAVALVESRLLHWQQSEG